MSFLSGRIVVVPFDFSSMAQTAVKRALEIVEDRSLIHVIFVGQLPSVAEPGAIYGTVTEESIRQHCHDSFQDLGKEHSEFAGLHFVTLIGDAGLSICEYAAQQDAELIVISSHGRTGIPRLLLGSVAERVVRHASCPVLVLRG